MTIPRPLRLLLIAAGSAFGLLVVAAVASLYLFLQPDRFTAMLQAQAKDAGLQLNLSSPASPTLFPRPALQLEGITLIASDTGARDTNMPIVLAANGRLVLPWRTLLGGPVVVSRIQINSPRVDLDALQAWLTSLPPQSAVVPAQIPRIATGVRIRNGSVVEGNSEWLNEVALDTGRLAPGHPFSIQLSGREPDGTRLQLQFASTPSMDNGVLRLDDMTVHAADNSATELHLTGNGSWKGAANAMLQLQGKFSQRGNGDYDAALMLTPADQNNPLLLHLKLFGTANHIDLKLPPLALAQWWNQMASPLAPKISAPPGSGQIDMAALDIGKVHIEGLSIRTGDAVPASSESVHAPARSAAPHPL